MTRTFEGQPLDAQADGPPAERIPCSRGSLSMAFFWHEAFEDHLYSRLVQGVQHKLSTSCVTLGFGVAACAIRQDTSTADVCERLPIHRLLGGGHGPSS